MSSASQDERRAHLLNQRPVADPREGLPCPVVYWMHREHRVRDNFALSKAQELARELKAPLQVLYCLAPGYGPAPLRAFGFLLRCLQEVETSLAARKIPFSLLTGAPGTAIPQQLEAIGCRVLVTDFDPARIKTTWLAEVCSAVSCQVIEVDARNVVPARFVTDKREYGAYTIRPKIHRLLPDFLFEPPEVVVHAQNATAEPKTDWDAARASLTVDETVPEVDWAPPGEIGARALLGTFLSERLAGYAERRNDPNADATSRLSPYLHFGCLWAGRAALSVSRLKHSDATASFLEELIVRRELSDNFVLHTPNYDRVECFPTWAGTTLAEHATDPREHLYSREQFEGAQTHDPLWNAAQLQMVSTGYMHNYLRMYWAKKILEWTRDAQEAMDTAIYLNDRYELDGRDTNGYAGIAWSIGGVHDRAWAERPIFGKIRYMSSAGCRRKFDVDAFVETHG